MSRIRYFTALYAAKLFARLLKLLHRNGSHYPGVLALKICPDFLKQTAKPAHILGITGTNGKTTVTNLVSDALAHSGYSLISNRAGSNILGGIATTFVTAVDLSGKPRTDLMVLEIDERSSRLIFPYVQPELLIVNNLFRDSMKRNAHSEFVFDILNASIPASTKLILNADDPISARLAPANERVYFSVDPQPDESTFEPNMIQDLPYCPYCGAPLVYDFRRYHHIGRVHCSKCEFASPEAEYRFLRIDEDRAFMETPNGSLICRRIETMIPDMYNQIAVTAMLSEYGLTSQQITAAFDSIGIVGSRFQEKMIGHVKVMLRVAKGQNPVAVSRVMDGVGRYPGRSAVLLAMDDLRDALETCESNSWHYDTDYEFLNSENVVQIVVGGPRALDHVLRLELAGVDPAKISWTLTESEAVKLIRTESCDTIWLLRDTYNTQFAAQDMKYLEEHVEGGETA